MFSIACFIIAWFVLLLYVFVKHFVTCFLKSDL